MGSRADRDLHLHHPSEHRQAVARRRVSQRFDLWHSGRGEKGIGQEHCQNHRIRIYTGIGHTTNRRRTFRRSTRLPVDQKPIAS